MGYVKRIYKTIPSLVTSQLVIHLIIQLVVIILTSFSTLAFPFLPSQFSGNININDKIAPSGTNIIVLDENNTICANITTKIPGKYEISCKGDDPATKLDEGATPNSQLRLVVNNTLIDGPKWIEGSFTNFDIMIWKTNDSFSPIFPPQPSPSNKEPKEEYYLLFTVFLILLITLSIKVYKKK